MGATTAAPPQAAEATKARRRPKAVQGPKTPWYMWLAVVAIVLFCLFPFYWLINLSLKTGEDLGGSTLYPPNPTLANYESIFNNGDFTRALLNSAIISLSTTALALIFRTLDALRIFDLPYFLTKGANGTTTLSLISQQTFAENRIYGLGAAYSVLTFIVVMIVSFTYIRTVGGNIRGLAEE